MRQVIIKEGTEQRHGPLIALVAPSLARIPGSGAIMLCDAHTAPERCRGDDTVVVLARGDEERVARSGSRRAELTYRDPLDPLPLAALVAGVAQERTPVVLDVASQAVLALAERIARSDIPVLIDGPTGTGKEVISRFLHGASARASGPFVAVNCAAMPESMLDAMLFGHRKGAFTGATEAADGFFRAADGGTLLLDEIAEMPLGLQAKLLRALQESEVVPIGATKPVRVDVRVIACANRHLPQEVAEGRFRADLYYRLNVFPLSLPALRERPDDIAPLAFAMLLRHGEGGAAPGWIDRAAMQRLCGHAWPGNVRELENVMRRALVLATGERVLRAEHIVFDGAARMLAPVTDKAPTTMREPLNGRLSAIVRQREEQAIADTLQELGGNRLETARKLGISERTLRYRLAGMRDAGIAVLGAVR